MCFSALTARQRLFYVGAALYKGKEFATFAKSVISKEAFMFILAFERRKRDFLNTSFYVITPLANPWLFECKIYQI